MIVRWPGHTAQASQCDDYVIIEDFYPSILEMAGVECNDTIDGVSFVPLIEGTSNPSKGRGSAVEFPQRVGASWSRHRFQLCHEA